MKKSNETMFIQLSKLNKSYEFAKTLIEDLDLTISDGNVLGIIGRNGEGKTTLLKTIAGIEQPDSGSINFSTSDLSIGYHSQFVNIETEGDLTLEDSILRHFPELFSLNTEISKLTTSNDPESITKLLDTQAKFEEEGGYAILGKIDEALDKLNLKKLGLNTKVSTLSGGEKTKLQLARILVQNPDILLLDEPTNHLDLESIEFLEDYIRERKGITIIVSHDRKFLNNTVNQILELEKGRWKLYFGSYDDYKREKELERNRLDEEIKRSNKENQKLRDAISDKRSKVHHNMTRKVDKKKYGKHARTSLRNRAGKQAKTARVYAERFTKRLEDSESKKAAKFRELGFKIEAEKVGNSDFALRMENLNVLVSLGNKGSKLLISNASMEVEPGQRVAVLGNNGAGKTTLLEKIVESYENPIPEIKFSKSAQVGYYSQEHEEIDLHKTLIENIRDAQPMTREEASKYLFWMQFEIHQLNNKASTLSQGEKSKLALTKLLIQKHNFLILDEPTNHLDIPSREVLENALKNYEGTILTVSHDRYFLEAIEIEEYYKIEDLKLTAL